MHDIKRTIGGLEYIIALFKTAFPDAPLVREASALRAAARNTVVIAPVIFPFRRQSGRTEFLPMLEELCTTEAVVILSLFWDTLTVPLDVFSTFPRVDFLHIPSRFLDSIFRHPRTIFYPPAVRDFPKRTHRPMSKVIGLLLASPHRRKNPMQSLQRLASRLQDYTFVVVGNYFKWVKEGLPPNVHVWGRISNEALIDFYHMLDWFVVLSGGEGYCLPAREALRCGVPVIAPRHTAFLDLEGVRGVYLVDTERWDGGNEPTLRNLLWEIPKVEQVEEIIRRVAPPPPSDVEDPTPTVSEWVQFWQQRIREIKKTQIIVKEKVATFITYPPPWGAGLNAVSRRWAKIANCDTIVLHYGIPEGLQNIIVIPYAHPLTDWRSEERTTSPLYLLRMLRHRNPKATIVLWVHNFLPHHIWFLHMKDICDVVATTTEELRESIFYRLPAPVLPLPFGDPPQNTLDSIKPHFIFWGVNTTPIPFIASFARSFPYPIRVLRTAGDNYTSVESYFAGLQNVCVVVTPPLSDDEIEKELDEAAGYLCFDFYLPIIYGEASAKIPHVLRKGKPILANSAPRNAIWGQYIKLVDCSMDVKEAVKEAPRIARYVVEHLNEFIPQNVPPQENDVKIFERFVQQTLALRRG